MTYFFYNIRRPRLRDRFCVVSKFKAQFAQGLVAGVDSRLPVERC